MLTKQNAADRGLTVEDAITALQAIVQANPNRKWHLVVRKNNPGGMSGHQTTQVASIHAGFDWEAGRAIIESARPLAELSPDDAQALRESAKQGQSWHAYQAHTRQLHQLSEALGVKVATISDAVREIEKLRHLAAGPGSGLLDAPKTPRLTRAEKSALEHAATVPREVTLGYNNGAAVAAKRRMYERLCAAGLMKPYVHGGYEITDAGRQAIDRDLPKT
jgi:hypothetical protein